MSEERQPLWPLIVAVLIGLPGLYVLSDGPAWYWARQRTAPDWALTVYQQAYGPILFVYSEGPPAFHTAIDWQDSLWAELGVR
jgi:hypothetical protein